MCVNPCSDTIGKDLGQPPDRPPGPPCNHNDNVGKNDYCDVSENDYCEDKNKNKNDVRENDYYEEIKNDYYTEHVPFNHHRYPDGQHVAMYMKRPLLPPRNGTHDRKHQKK